MRLARAEERLGDGCHDLEAWSASHLEAGAALPLHPYYTDFLTFIGIAPFQLISNGYRVLAGLFVLYKMQGWSTPSPAEILYLYNFRQVPKIGRSGRLLYSDEVLMDPKWVYFKYVNRKRMNHIYSIEFV